MTSSKFLHALSLGALICGTPSIQIARAEEVQEVQEVRVEAEARLASGDIKMSEDTAASGGRAVSSGREWQPLLFADVPGGARPWNVWIRHKNGPLALKSLAADGTQQELGWVWDAPAEWKWSRVATISRAQATQVLVIRGAKQATPDAILDCLAFTQSPNPPDARPAPNTARPIAEPPMAAAPDGAADKAPDGAPPPAALAVGAMDVPAGQLFQAEASLGAGKVQDARALGGQAVSSQAEWQPLARLPLPPARADEPNGFTVWLRHKSGPLLLKSEKGGQQGDLQWIWDSPDEWKWTALGPYSRQQIGEALIVIRGGKDAAAPLLDAIVLAPASVRELPPESPNPALPPIEVQPTVQWNKISHPFPRSLWGLNDYEILDPKSASDEKFQALLGSMSPPLIRIHSGGFSDAWTDEATRSWNRDKIVAVFRASTGYAGARVMLNIARPPGWLSKNTVLSEAEEDAWAAQMADLARLLRAEKIHVDYWELTNELDTAYEKAGRLDDLWRLWNKAARAVRAADPEAKIGGPALTWPKPEWVQGLLKNCGENLDFVSWHSYASGDMYDSNEQILARPQAIASMAHGVAEAARKLAPKRKIELFLTELNIKWVWEPIERRHGNSIGALFLASSLAHIAPLRLDGVTVWHAKGNAYGLISGDDTLRSTGALYLWSKYLWGQAATSSSSDEKSLEVLAIVRPGGKKSLLLMAKAGQSVAIQDAASLLGTEKWSAQRIDADGLHSDVELPARGRWIVPGYSLTLLMNGGE